MGGVGDLIEICELPLILMRGYYWAIAIKALCWLQVLFHRLSNDWRSVCSILLFFKRLKGILDLKSIETLWDIAFGCQSEPKLPTPLFMENKCNK